TASDHVGNIAVINETLTIDTTAPDGPIIASVDQAVGGFRGITIETTMENGVATSDTATVVQVDSNGNITDVDGTETLNTRRSETDFDFDTNVPNGSHLIVNSTDDAAIHPARFWRWMTSLLPVRLILATRRWVSTKSRASIWTSQSRQTLSSTRPACWRSRLRPTR
ncbi:MAG: hypothetical protein P8P40_04150, partial [Sulfitobacter sp.]|nr:hypothetical protein [Sulfitobacter sp.]